MLEGLLHRFGRFDSQGDGPNLAGKHVLDDEHILVGLSTRVRALRGSGGVIDEIGGPTIVDAGSHDFALVFGAWREDLPMSLGLHESENLSPSERQIASLGGPPELFGSGIAEFFGQFLESFHLHILPFPGTASEKSLMGQAARCEIARRGPVCMEILENLGLILHKVDDVA